MTVEEYINRQTPENSRLLAELHRLILDTGPKIQQKIKWGIPFYTYKGDLCYLNPLRTPEGGIDLCFLRGFELADEQGVLEARGRKTVRSIAVRTGSLDEKLIRELLHQAILLNQTSREKPGGLLSRPKGGESPNPPTA
ncbi:DUF1801 domain-containing protein [Larkinella soli]|uniref:DUF1801 domain-containing protein n=1 Tax=Larkinella soli TaxID=1770527 RepID=UPI000FFC39F8|nr:DUF1801 domain-containing protein [Larkinella soli]